MSLRVDPAAFGRLKLRIRTWLVLLALAVALPFAGFAVHSSVAEARIERSHAGAEMLGTARVTAARLDDYLNDIGAVMAVLTSLVSIDASKTADNDALLRSLEGHLPLPIDDLGIWSAAGQNVGSLGARREQGPYPGITDRAFFKGALAERGDAMSVEAPVMSTSRASPLVIFSLPVRRGGRTVGVVAATTSLSALQDLLKAGNELPASAVMTIIDHRGIVLARSIDPERWVGKRIPGGGDVNDGIRDGPSADGLARIAGSATVHAASWHVYVGLPVDIALAQVHARLRNNLLAAGLVLLAGLLLAALIGEQIASPLRQLNADATQFGAGNLSHRSEFRGKGELGNLAATFNKMAAQLQEREVALSLSRQQLRQVTDNLPALISYLDVDERFRFANRVYADWFGTDADALIGRSLLEFYGQQAYDRFKANVHRALGGERVVYEREIPTLGGTRRVEVVVIPDIDADARVLGLYVMMTDITARQNAEAAQRRSEQRLQMVADNIPAIVTYIDREERYRFVNATLEELFQVESSTILGRTVREAGGERLYAQIGPYIAAALRGEEVTFQDVLAIGGRRYHYQSTYIPDFDAQGQVQGYYAMTFDISELKETQRQLATLASLDTLTGLPNRRQFDDRLLAAMTRAGRAGVPMVLMFLDVDHFKTINDTLGHAAGDLVLKEFAARLKALVRSTDIAARLGGDEFVILLEGMRKIEEIEALAGKIVRSARAPIMVDGRAVCITTSVGVARYLGAEADASMSATDLMAAADKALYASKEKGRDGFTLSGREPPCAGTNGAS